ncbi:MAG TPA: hypothetical protein O0X50_03550, partial [Methanocorpusculum sp.]|nr:hypothetical protein [Methanocorpusculum sp.]
LFIGCGENIVDGVVLEDLICTGGICTCKANLTITGSTNVTGTNYYAIYCNEYSKATIVNGTFTTKDFIRWNCGVLNCEKTNGSGIDVRGGAFYALPGKQPISPGTEDNITVSGGYFSADVTPFVAPGHTCIVNPDAAMAAYGFKVIKGVPLTVTFNMTGQSDYKQGFISGVPQQLTPNKFPNQEGYDFLGWNETVENGSVDYIDSAWMTLTDKDLTLHAVWQKQIKPSIPEGTTIKPSDTGSTNITVKDSANLTINITAGKPVATLISDTANITMTYESEGFTNTSTAANGTILSIVVEPKLSDKILGPTQDTSARNNKAILNIKMNESNPNAIETSIPQVILAFNATKADDLNASLNPKGHTKYVAIGAMIEGKPQNDLTSTQMNTNISKIEMGLYVNASWIDLHGRENIKVYHIADNGTAQPISDFKIGDKIETVGGEDFYIVTIRSELGFSAYSVAAVWDKENPTPHTPSSSKQTGSTIILSEGEVAPTTTPTPAATQIPTSSPTAKQTTLPTQQSPVPFFGILAGLGAAALVLSNRRK